MRIDLLLLAVWLVSSSTFVSVVLKPRRFWEEGDAECALHSFFVCLSLCAAFMTVSVGKI